MRYSNPQPKEGINVSKRHPLADFARLLLSVTILVGVLAVGAAVSVGWLVKFVPFEFEQQLAARFPQSTPQPGPEQRALQALADKLVVHMELDPRMDITVHYVDEDVANAFATLGGNVVFFRGLIESLPNENALAMVMAHEIAHVQHRHPIASLGRGMAIALSVMAITGSSGADIPDGLVGDLGMFSSLSFSRSQERESDQTALAALFETYGHTGGAATLFLGVARRTEDMRPPEILSTHPDPGNRVQTLDNTAFGNDWPRHGELTPLAPALEALTQEP